MPHRYRGETLILGCVFHIVEPIKKLSIYNTGDINIVLCEYILQGTNVRCRSGQWKIFKVNDQNIGI